MAIIAVGENGEFLLKCPLCGSTLSEPIYATSHFIADEKDPLWRYSDAAMHWECYCAWDQRERFASLYFEAQVRYAESPIPSGYWCIISRTDLALVTYGLAVHQISIVLKESGTNFRIGRKEWPAWLAGEWQNQCRGALELEALRKVIPNLATLSLPPDT